MTTNTINIEFDAAMINCNVGGKAFEADLTKMPNASLVKIFAYGFQRSVNDRCGGMETDAKHEMAGQVIERIMDGSIAATATRSGEPAINRYIRKIFRKIVLAKKIAAFADLTETKERDDWLMTTFAKQSDDVRESLTGKAQAAMDKDIADKKANAALAGEFEIDL